jgi:alpha-L-fucosidase
MQWRRIRRARGQAAVGVAALGIAAFVSHGPPAAPTVAAQAGDPVTVSLGGLRDNNGIGVAPGDANIDGSGYGFPASELPTGLTTVDGVPYELPGTQAAGQVDNVVALGQTVDIPDGSYIGAHTLLTSTYGTASGTATVHYADGTTSSATLSAPDWYSGGASSLGAPYRYSPSGVDQHSVHIYPTLLWMDPTRTATSVTLPTTRTPAPNVSSLHVFALTLQPAVPGAAVQMTKAASTTLHLGSGQHADAQVVEVSLLNIGTEWVTPGNRITVSVDAPGVRTVAPAMATYLAPGEEARLKVGITSPTLPPGTPVDATVRAVSAHGDVSTSRDVTLSAGIAPYDETDATLSQHKSPIWFDDAKFGIFIHWGVYSVPAWAPVGVQYAEWYWNQMNDPNNPTYRHHLETYGADFDYDDFIPQFTADKFNPKEWVQLFREAGAKYYVLTSKHHEGFALYDSDYSNRTSVDMGPHKDLVKMLFDASRKYTPNIRPGLYFSLPEWYNPDEPWSGHGPRNPYTGEPLPYTGYTSVRDYVQDYQVPQLKEIIRKYDPKVLWCDIGSPATDRSVLTEFFNQALAQGDDVAVDNRCGLPTYDFTTPEYATSFSLQTSKFEASRGIDPRSYGYNAQTPDEAYATADDLIDQFVDIVSKNGNLLLDIGPRADGTIPEIMQTRLRQIGTWLETNGEAIYDSTYWARGATDGALRFTVQQNKAFYITSLSRPGDQVVVRAPVPIQAGDEITLLGHDRPLSWTKQDGNLVIDVPPAAANSGEYAWTFKIDWKG